MASAWCGGMLRMPVTALMISSCTAHTHLSISLHRAKQSRSGYPSLTNPSDWGAGAMSAHVHSSVRVTVLRSTFVALAWAAFSPAVFRISWTAPLASTLSPTNLQNIQTIESRFYQWFGSLAAPRISWSTYSDPMAVTHHCQQA